MSKFPKFRGQRLSLDVLQSEISHAIERVWQCGIRTAPFDGQDWAPPIELRDEPNRYVLFVELPGLERSTIDLSANPTSVSIRGEKLSPPEQVDQPVDVIESERQYGSFKREVRLPGTIETDAMSATVSNGVLEIILPKASEPVPNDVRVEIQTPTDSGRAVFSPELYT